MDGHLQGNAVHVGADARQRFYDSRGYGRPLDGNDVVLAPVEAAHLLFRGDIDSVDGMGFREFFAYATEAAPRFGVRFLVYHDLRRRGFYLSPAREEWAPEWGEDLDFVVYPRGSGPDDGAVEYRICVVGERERLAVANLGECVLAVVDEESEITYLDTERATFDGSSRHELPSAAGDLLGDRVLCWNAPDALYESAFYGQPLTDDAAVVSALQLSLVEAAYLAAEGVLSVEGGADAVVAHGREVEGDRFDRRLQAYTALRTAGVVPKTGFKFGADFRTYAAVESVDDLGHSERLVRAVPLDYEFAPRDLSLDVRLAHGVRKEMVFALCEEDVSWVAVRRLTP